MTPELSTKLKGELNKVNVLFDAWAELVFHPSVDKGTQSNELAFIRKKVGAQMMSLEQFIKAL